MSTLPLIDIDCSNFPRYDLNYGVTADEAAEHAMSSEPCHRPLQRVANNVIYADAAHPSSIALPMRKVSLDPNADPHLANEALIPFSSVWMQRRPTWSR